MHGLGVTERVVAAIPDTLVPLIEALTLLGDPAVLAAAVTLVYWHGPGRIVKGFADGMALVAGTLSGMAAVAALKPLFAHSRPAAALVAESGFTFPSGHATGAAAAFTAGALVVTALTPRRRWGVALAGTALVSFTRVALGVHYVPDVLVGAVLGGAAAFVTVRLARRRADFGLRAAAVVGALGYVATGASDPLAVGGVAGGAALAWGLGENRTHPSPARTLVGLLAVGALLGPVLALSLADGVVAISSVVGGATLSGLPAQNFSR